MSSSSSSVSVSGMNLGFQKLKERIITTTTCATTQLRRSVPSIIDTIGCDITIGDIQLAKKELINLGVDLKMDVNKNQKISSFSGTLTPLIHCCRSGNLLTIKILFLIGADCSSTVGVYWFPMLVAAKYSHLDICKWLYEYGGDAKYQINKQARFDTPLGASYDFWKNDSDTYGHMSASYLASLNVHGVDREGKTCRWLLRNGGGQHLSNKVMHKLMLTNNTNSNLLVLWTRENIQLHDTFTLLLYGAATMITSSSSLSSSEPSESCTSTRKRKRLHQQRSSLQIFAGHPGIMEWIGNCVGLIRGKEIRMLQEFNKLVIKYNKTVSK